MPECKPFPRLKGMRNTTIRTRMSRRPKDKKEDKGEYKDE
jgi:hypothetical protein